MNGTIAARVQVFRKKCDRISKSLIAARRFRARHFGRIGRISIGASLVLCIYFLFGGESPPSELSLTSVVLKPPLRTDTGDETHLDREESGSERNTADSSTEKHQVAQIEEEPACHLPALKPLDPRIPEFDKPPLQLDCTKKHPLLFKTDFESNLVQVGNPKEFGYSSCCYQPFHRPSPGTDKKVTFDPKCIPIETKEVKISNGIDFIRVSCEKSINGTNTSVPVDFFGLVHLKPVVEAKAKKIEDGASYSTKERKVNIVILGLESVSHMNFQRILPKSRDYLVKNLSAFYLDGYSRIADMTYPNVVAALTGLTEWELQEQCSADDFDECPFLWKKFKAQGYRTAYGEEVVQQGIFTVYGGGFNKTPTDYYYNGLMYQLEENLGHKHIFNDKTKFCYGPRPVFSVSLDYLQKMAVRMNKSRRYFQFMLTAAMTRGSLTGGRQGDQPLLETLKWFKDKGYLEDTVFVLMSDQGMRHGDITKTVQGNYEVNMPFAYFILPEWFKEKYGSAVDNLLQNRNRLTTHYDLHETLLDLSNLESISEKQLNQRSEELKRPDLPRGISLFRQIPLQRTCNDAGIDEQCCVCRKFRPIQLNGNTLVQEGALQVVKVMNEMLAKYSQCSPLVLNRILSAQVLEASNREIADISAIAFDIESNDPLLRQQQVSFSLSILVRPSDAIFEAKTSRNTDGSWHVQGEISRKNPYRDQSRCVKDRNLKSFCYCV